MNLRHALPRVPLAGGPTPLQLLPRLSAALRGPTLWCKRDDQTALAGGGNKARKLEYLMALARQQGADTVVTFGGVHSNHARMTAAAARMCGLSPVLVLTGTLPVPAVGNPLLDALLGARIVTVPDHGKGRDAAVAALRETLAAEGRRVAWIPGGGSTPLGAMGYVRALFELRAQCEAEGITPAAVWCAAGTEGTWRGLRAGAALARWPVAIEGVAVATPAERAGFGVTDEASFFSEMGELLGEALTIPAAQLIEDQVGGAYGAVTEAGVQAMAQAAQAEGLILDPVYTGKALAGLLARIVDGGYRQGEHVVFVHTGGWPGLAPKAAAIEAALAATAGVD